VHSCLSVLSKPLKKIKKQNIKRNRGSLISSSFIINYTPFNSRVKTSIISNTHHHHKHNTSLITRFRTEPDPNSPPQITVFETAAGQPATHRRIPLLHGTRFCSFFSVYSQSILLSVFVIFSQICVTFSSVVVFTCSPSCASF
jgi:hypothetical protein